MFSRNTQIGSNQSTKNILKPNKHTKLLQRNFIKSHHKGTYILNDIKN